RLLLWGPFDAEAAARARPAAWLQPFRGARPAALPLLGLVAPWPDGELDGAIVHDRWAELPWIVLARIVSELVRVAGRALFLLGQRGSKYGPRAAWVGAVDGLPVSWRVVRA